jgi:hypothetical protein
MKELMDSRLNIYFRYSKKLEKIDFNTFEH